MKATTMLETGLAVGTALTKSRLLRPVDPRSAFRMGRALAAKSPNAPLLAALSAARWPDRVALVDDLGALTYADLASWIDAVASGLHHEFAAGTGTAVAVMCRNSRYAVAGLLGVMATGADVVLLNTDFHSEALRRSLARHEMRVIICDAEFEAALRAAGYTGPLVLAFAATRAEPAEGRAPGGSVTVDGWVRRGYRSLGRMPVGRLVILTSGTTGTPKGVPRRPGLSMIAGTAASILHRTGLRTGSVIAVGIPMFHGFGLGVLLLGLALGGKLVMHRHFDAEAALAAIAGHRVDMFAGVPVMMQRILALPNATRRRYDLSSLRVALSGAAPLSPALAREFTAVFGEVLYNGYGSSEVGIGALATPADLRVAPGTVGRPVTGVEVRILDEAGRELPPWAVGRIFVGGDLGFSGYSGGGNKDRVDGRISSGDMGYLDAGGRLFLVGREDDMIVSGGENVYPQEVEYVLADHPALAEVAVIGVDDAEYGQRLAVFAVLAPGHQLDPGELRDFLHDKVARYQRPRDITLVPEIPRNATGKVDRKALRGTVNPSGAA
ncbi:AMP-binding protein [Nocardia sp. NPDC127526]|uniref:AMP-binding protein n=1 Tax=Nocardia sp. NPDC127526 TaxID=3345393 RepID=UPI0036411CBA